MVCSRASACGLKKPQRLRIVHRRTNPGAMIQLPAVGIADHVVVKHDAAHPGQLHAAGLQRITPAHLEPLGPLDDLLADFLRPGVVEASVRPVAVRRENGRQPAAAGKRGQVQFVRSTRRAVPANWTCPLFPLGTIEVAGDEEAGIALEKDLFDRVSVPIHSAVDDGVERHFDGHRPQAGSHQHLPPQLCGTLLPGFAASGRREAKIAVEIRQRPKTPILRQLPGGQHPR